MLIIYITRNHAEENSLGTAHLPKYRAINLMLLKSYALQPTRTLQAAGVLKHLRNQLAMIMFRNYLISSCNIIN